MSLRERVHSEIAMRRLASNPNVRVLGNTSVERLPIFSFLIYPPPVSNSNFKTADEPGCCSPFIRDVSRKRLPLHGRFVTRLLNDLFGIQARGGCACAGPYGHTLLEIENELSLRIRSAILQV
jgi:selenocysteine lyase/cysteine desulfurase